MQTISLDVTSNTANAAALKAALETYGGDFFDSVTVADNVVSCYVGSTVFLTITIPASGKITVLCKGETVDTTFTPNSNVAYAVRLHVFDTALVIVPGSAGNLVETQPIVIAKNKAGDTAVLAASISYSSNVVTINPSSSTQSLQVAAAVAFRDVYIYYTYRNVQIGGQLFGIPFSTGDSYTDDVLFASVSVFNGQTYPHQITVGGASWWAVSNDSFYIRSN